MRQIRKLLLILIFFLSLYTQLFAGNTGKIAGKIIDGQVGEPLVGANVIIVGTNLGAATGEDGYYYILQVPPGIYEMKVIYIGYKTVTVKGIRVNVDLTTIIDIDLETQAIEGQEVTVIAQQKVIQHDVTSTRKTTSREDIDRIPGLESTSDVFKLRGGTFMDQIPQKLEIGGTAVHVRDESLKDIHVRGGRGGEILYMVDGMPVTHPIYGGRNVLDLNLDDVQEIELLTGAFTAEYGQAQSGVVNITTRSGSDKFKGGFQIKTDETGNFADTYNEFYSSAYIEGPEPFTKYILPKIGLNIPGRLYYFLSGNTTLTNTAYNNHRERDDLSFLGFHFPEKQNNTSNLNGKLDYRFTNKFKLTFSYHGNYLKWSDFDWTWKNFPDHMATSFRNTNNYTLKINHTLSKSTYYTLSFGHLDLRKKTSLDGQKPYDFWSFYSDSTDTIGNDFKSWKAQYPGQDPYRVVSNINAPVLDEFIHFYDGTGYQCPWIDENANSTICKAEITSQITNEHLIKTGVDVKYDDIHFVNIADGGIKKSDYGKYVYPDPNQPVIDSMPPVPSGPFKEFGQTRWIFDAYPVTGSLYLQDKHEKKGYGLIINTGLRIDWFMLGSTVLNKSWKQQWENATGLAADWKNLKYKISPRFGISFPISENTVIFFSYGHFTQLPELHYFYRDPHTGGVTGNPHLDFEQTILYEFGFTHRLSKNWVIDIKNYSKDISDQVGFTSLLAARGLAVEIPDNKSYQRAKGLEFELRKIYSNHTSGDVTYTIQWANGYSSSAFDDYIRSQNDLPYPIRERRVGYDIRHQIIFSGTLESPGHDPMNLFGITLPQNWQLTILSRFSSGSPYTPYTSDIREQQKLENTSERPFTTMTDMKFNKNFNFGNTVVSFYIDVFNIFDQYNVTGSGFNTETGKPYRYGDLINGSNMLYDWNTMYSMLSPFQFSNGRHAKIGIRVTW